MAAAACAGLLALGVGGAAPSEPLLYRLEVHDLEPGAQATYEAAAAELAGALSRARVRLRTWDYSVMSNGAARYVTVDPYPEWAALDAFDGEGTAVAKLLGARLGAFHAKAHSAIRREHDFFVQSDPGNQGAAALGENGLNFIHAELYYARSYPAVKQTLAQIRSLFRSRDWRLDAHIYRAVTGDDLPLLILVTMARNENAYRTARAAVADDPTLHALLNRAQSASRRVEQVDFVVRPELSYHAAP